MNSELENDTRESIEERVKKVVLQHVKDAKNFDDSKKFSEQGVDSLDAVEIIMDAEEEFGILIPDEDAQKMETLKEMVKYIASKKS